jgi:hypothetical protein
MTERFDAVAWMRQRRAEIDEEDASLSWKEKALRTRELLEGMPAWERLKGRVIEAGRPAALRT